MADEEKVQPKAKRERPQEPSPKEAEKLAEENARALTQRKGGYAPDPKKVFTVKNVVRRVQTRLRRASAPGRLRFKQMIGGRRLLRNQKMMLTPEQFERVAEEVMRGLQCGALEMTDPDGWSYFVTPDGRLGRRKGDKVEIKGEKPKPPPKAKPKVEEPEEVEEPEVEEVEEPEPDDLTELPGVGAGRAKKLEAAGVTTFKQISEMPPGDLAKILGSPVTEDQAADICDAASEKEG